jgi:hypothetical protein
MDFHDPYQKAMQVRYHLRCKVLVKECTYEDQQSKGNQNISEKLVFLVPEDSDERTRFFIAWLPDTLDSFQELGIEMGHPVFSAFRAALYRKSTFHPELPDNHIFVMSKGAEEILKRLDGQMVMCEILGEQEEYLLDGMIDHDLSLNKNIGQFVPKSVNLSEDN